MLVAERYIIIVMKVSWESKRGKVSNTFISTYVQVYYKIGMLEQNFSVSNYIRLTHFGFEYLQNNITYFDKSKLLIKSTAMN